MPDAWRGSPFPEVTMASGECQNGIPRRFEGGGRRTPEPEGRVERFRGNPVVGLPEPDESAGLSLDRVSGKRDPELRKALARFADV